MTTYTAMNMKTRETVEIEQAEVVKMKNGVLAVRGIAGDDHVTKVFRILKREEKEALPADFVPVSLT